MAEIGHSLMIKYGLSRRATPEEGKAWAELTQTLIRAGISKDRAGQQAAAQLLPGYNTHVYASEADAIEMLLNRANEK